MWRLTQRVRLPTVALGLLWIVHSVATTMYVPWQNQRQRAALSSVQSTVETALRIQEKLSQLQSLAGKPDGRAQTTSLQQALSADIVKLQGQLDDPASKVLLARMATWVDTWDPTTNDPKDSSDLQDLIVDCQQFIRSEQVHLLDAVDQRSRTDVAVMVVRAVLLVLGLAIGLGLAVWMSRSLTRSLSQISVTLRSVEGNLDTDLGHINVISDVPPEELSLIETQVDHVVRNLRRVADELHETRQGMLRAERLAAVGEVAAGVAHEIRNPLTSVKLLIQRAAERTPVHSLTEEQLHVLLEEVSRMENTVQGLLDFARPEKPHYVNCELLAIVKRTLTLLEGRLYQNHIKLVMENGNTHALLHCDPSMIQQVLVNIIINAIDSMPEGGTLTVRQSCEPETSFAVVEFSDTGPGIESAVLARLFEPFVTTRANGSGLGLAISKRLIEEQGGTLTATNLPGGGATFVVRLPQSRESYCKE
ncbi:ATP-binding protein [Schlesneria sp.]|uniref:sensor histidine kinase n=1 Tax=Schlesneria sp. TaxID=2762018 RepID=UPI002EF0B2F9